MASPETANQPFDSDAYPFICDHRYREFVDPEDPTNPHKAAVNALVPLAEQIEQDPQLAEWVLAMKYLTMGDDDRQRRFGGHHPWPERDIDGRHYVYTVPVTAGVKVEPDTKRPGRFHYSAISVMKDNWRDDPDAWLAVELDLETGVAKQHGMLGAVIDAARQLNLILKPSRYENMSPHCRPQIDNRPLRDQRRISTTLDEQYHGRPISWLTDTYKQSSIILDISYLEVAREQVALAHLSKEMADIALADCMTRPIVEVPAKEKAPQNLQRLRALLPGLALLSCSRPSLVHS